MKRLLTKFILTIAVFSANAHADEIDVSFFGSCAHGDFDAQEGDIEFFNLNLDIIWGHNFDQKKCDILVKIPMRHGYYIAINKFKVEGFADIENRHGFAALQVKHKSTGDWISAKKDVIKKSGDLEVKQKSIARSMCHKSIKFLTRIEVKTLNADFFQDSAQSNISGLKYKYVQCH